MGNGTSLEALSKEQVAEAVKSKGEKYEAYGDAILANGVDGDFLASMDDEEALTEILDELGITSKLHQKVLSRMLVNTKSHAASSEPTKAPTSEKKNPLLDGELFVADMASDARYNMASAALQDELDAIKADVIADADDAIIGSVMKQIKDLSASRMVEKAIKRGDVAPSFSLQDVDGTTFDSGQQLATGKKIVVSFFKGGWCPYCNMELQRFQTALADFEEADAALVAISPSLPESSQSLAERNGTTYHVLSDVNNVVAKQFGLVYTLAEELRPVYKEKWKMDVPSATGTTKWELPLPATYIIGTDGRVLCSFVDVDYTLRAEPSEILAILKAFA